MENFIVSARKYRPATFETVVGQKSITATLKNAIKNNHLAHAYLFTGPRGVGKTTCARIFAKTINCKNLTPELEACNQCESCLSFNESRSYNIHELDAASNNSVEDIRNLTDQVRIPPQIGKYSIYIIDEVHMLSTAAFNAFLKTLEEPPKHAIFILATTEKHKIIPTILSRCQIFDFNRIKLDDIAHHLAWVAQSENIKTDSDALNVIAQKADGGLRDALSYFDQIVSFSGSEITYKNVIDNLNVLDYEYYFNLTEAFLQNDISKVLLIFNEILEKGFDGHHFISGLSSHFRDLLVCLDEITVQLLEVGEATRQRYKELSTKCNADFLLKSLTISNQCDIAYKASRNQRLHIELSLLQLCNVSRQVSKNDFSKSAENISAQQSKPVNNVASIAQSQPVTAKPVNKPTTISIKGALKGDIQQSEQIASTEKDVTNIDNNNKADNSFTGEQLLEAWQSLTQQYISSGRIYSTLVSQIPVLKEGYNIELVLSNITQKEKIDEILQDLVNFLRSKLHNQKICINTVVSVKENTKKPLTVGERYNYLNEKNENLTKLKQSFNLEFS